MGRGGHHPRPVTIRPPDPTIDVHGHVLAAPSQGNALPLPDHPTAHRIPGPDCQLRNRAHGPIDPLQTYDLRPPNNHPNQHLHLARTPPPSLRTNIPRRRSPHLTARAEPELPPATPDPSPHHKPRAADWGDALPGRTIINPPRPPAVCAPWVGGRAQANDCAEDAKQVDLRQDGQRDRVPHARVLGSLRLCYRRGSRARHRRLGRRRQSLWTGQAERALAGYRKGIAGPRPQGEEEAGRRAQSLAG